MGVGTPAANGTNGISGCRCACLRCACLRTRLSVKEENWTTLDIIFKLKTQIDNVVKSRSTRMCIMCIFEQ